MPGYSSNSSTLPPELWHKILTYLYVPYIKKVVDKYAVEEIVICFHYSKKYYVFCHPEITNLYWFRVFMKLELPLSLPLNKLLIYQHFLLLLYQYSFLYIQ